MKCKTYSGKGVKAPVDWVDPFLGNGATDLPEASGIASTWSWLKAQVGNTHPGACYPFGMVSACAYSGAYVTGYGLYKVSTSDLPARRFEEYTASGFTHFHHSGTGMIASYYNYVRVIPLIGSLDQIGRRWKLSNETASPGYYSTELKGTGIKAELTVTRKAALHRYTFPESPSSRIAIDLSAGGLDIKEIDMRTIPTEADIRVISNRAVQGKVVMEGIPLYFYIETDFPSRNWGIWSDRKELSGQSTLIEKHIDKETFRPFGVLFENETRDGQSILVRLGFSLRSTEKARANMRELEGRTFEQVLEQTRETWSSYLNRIVINGGTSEQHQIFYSSLYHSLIKPSDFSDESPYWEEDGPFYLDLATMWDMYKTQLPLMLALYPERGRDVVNSLISVGEHYGKFPVGYVMDVDFEKLEGQASALAHITIADAYFRGIDGIDWHRAKDLMARTLRSGPGEQFINEGFVHPFSHTLDLACASFCTAQLAEDLGDADLHKEMMDLSGYWRNVYDPTTGRLGGSNYYEGDAWNYSFRLLHDMAGRIALYDREEDFIKDLDRFFGFDQLKHAEPREGSTVKKHVPNRFEGLNNESDMESPYAYIYAGRPDRTAEVVRAVMKYQYSTGRGGLPGNDDSGGLSSWYVWSSMGIFPVAGQNIFLIGSPIFESAAICLGDREFVIESRNNSDSNIYVQNVTLNGRSLDRAYLWYSEIREGGKLIMKMGPERSQWGRKERPPSYSNAT